MTQRIAIRVNYPLLLPGGRLALRTEDDWERDLPPLRQSRDGARFDFLVETDRPHFYFKPVLLNGDGAGPAAWAEGDNYLAVADRRRARDVFPYFHRDESCSECDEHALPAPLAARGYRVRVFLPPGYHENTLARYPVLYMQDGQNLFFAEEAFGGRHWEVRETMQALGAMNLVQRAVVVGVYPRERTEDYTRPGYEEYGRFLAEELHPWVTMTYRTKSEPRHTGVMGSSLGGVVSLFLAWQWPSVFGKVACLSSTFGWRDDLIARVRAEPKRKVRIYLDSGWPHDNYEATCAMRDALVQRGYRLGVDLYHLAFPRAAHDESHWAQRAHLPFQILYREGRE